MRDGIWGDQHHQDKEAREAELPEPGGSRVNILTTRQDPFIPNILLGRWTEGVSTGKKIVSRWLQNSFQNTDAIWGPGSETTLFGCQHDRWVSSHEPRRTLGLDKIWNTDAGSWMPLLSSLLLYIFSRSLPL